MRLYVVIFTLQLLYPGEKYPSVNLIRGWMSPTAGRVVTRVKYITGDWAVAKRKIFNLLEMEKPFIQHLRIHSSASHFWGLTSKFELQFQGSLCGICGEQRGNGEFFFSEKFCLNFSYHQSHMLTYRSAGDTPMSITGPTFIEITSSHLNKIPGYCALRL
jgi:hypothetical protein